MEVLTGLGLASAAGLNAYIPLLALGLLARWTDLVQLPSAWAWLSDPWALGILAVLLVVEVTADKIPGIDHVNDILQTVVRPVSGGLVVGAGTDQASLVQDPSEFFSSGEWVPVAVGAGIALAVHALKAGGRAVVNASTAGIGAPVASTAEDALAVGLSLAALLLPVLVLVLLVVLAVAVVRSRRRARIRRDQRSNRGRDQHGGQSIAAH
jgi:membrane protein implicated in regulation of membrane protease activity